MKHSLQGVETSNDELERKILEMTIYASNGQEMKISEIDNIC